MSRKARLGAGWAADPANDATNGGFIRDDGAVLAVFFVQDEPDQTPLSVGGKAMFDKLLARKAACGGERCIIGGGLVHMQCLPEVPLQEFFDQMKTNPAVVGQIPDGDSVTPDDNTKVLKGALAQVIDEACDNIIIPK